MRPAAETTDTAPADAGCAGKMRITRLQIIGLCLRCSRYGVRGEQIEPAARLRHGLAECVNFLSAE